MLELIGRIRNCEGFEMKRAVKVALVAAILQGSAHAAEKSATADAVAQPERGKVATLRKGPGSGKQIRMADGKNGKQAKAEKAVPEITVKQQ